MEKFRVGPHVEVELEPEGRGDFLLQFRVRLGPESVRVFLSREEAAHLAGILVHCVLQRAAPASAVKAFREMTIGELLEARALGKLPVEEEEPEEPESPDHPVEVLRDRFLAGHEELDYTADSQEIWEDLVLPLLPPGV